MDLMSAVQSTEEILDLLVRLVGGTISELQVFGINSLKSLAPAPADVFGTKISDVNLTDRIVEIRTDGYAISVDLQRTGRLRWLASAEPAVINATGRPTARLLLGSGVGVDFTEPSKTKRIAVVLTSRDGG